MGASCTIRAYQPGDEIGIVTLFNEIFPGEMSLERWRWKFSGGPFGQDPVCVAEGDGRIVGHHAMLPRPTKFGAETHLVGQLVDSMVLPAYRQGNGQGRTIILLSEWLKKPERGNRAGLLFGLPTERMERRLREMGYVHLFSLSSLVQVLNPGYVFRKLTARPRVQALGRKLGRLLGSPRRYLPHRGERGKDLEVRPVAAFDAQFDELWEVASTGFHIGTVRNAAYLKWRYASCPDVDYLTFGAFRGERLVGFVILRSMEEGVWRAGYLVDLLVPPDDDTVLHALITHCLAYARESGWDLLRTWITEHSPACRLLCDRGFALRPSTYRFLAGDVSPLIPDSLWRDPTRWYLTLGDTDIV